MKKLILMVIFLISCAPIEEKPAEKPNTAECATDADCATGGCSGQICGAEEKVKGLITTCEWREEYACLKLASCSCINNTCQWEEHNAYRNCLTMVKEEV